MNVYLKVNFFLNFITIIYFLDIHSIFYYKTLMTILTPIIFCLFFIIFWLTLKILHQLTILQAFQSYMLCFSIIISFFLSSIINSLAEFENCTNLYEETYIKHYLLEKCTNNPNYTLWRNVLIIPSFIFFCILIPFFAFHYVYKNRKRLFQKEVIQKFGFLLNGHSSKTFYWSYFIYLFIHSFFNFLGNLDFLCKRFC